MGFALRVSRALSQDAGETSERCAPVRGPRALCPEPEAKSPAPPTARGPARLSPPRRLPGPALPRGRPRAAGHLSFRGGADTDLSRLAPAAFADSGLAAHSFIPSPNTSRAPTISRPWLRSGKGGRGLSLNQWGHLPKRLRLERYVKLSTGHTHLVPDCG